MMHILPSSKVPFSRIPLDTMIANKLTFLKKNEKNQNKEGARHLAGKQHQPVHDRDGEAMEQSMVLIDEFKFPHVVR